MAYKTIRIGRHSGLPWMGLNERIEDGAQMPNEASAGQNFRVNKGVLETRPGITHATEVSARPTSYYVTLGATGQIRYDSADQYDVINGRVRWLWVLSVRTPASFSGTHWIIHRGVTIGGTQYEQGVYVDSNGKVYVKLVDSAGGDKTFNSGANTLSVDTNYVITVGRFDTDAYLNWGTETSSPTVGVMGTTSDLGELDHAWSSGSGAHTLNIGHEYDLGTTTPSNYWKGEIHEVTLLQYYVNHAPDPSTGWYCEFGWTSFADPLDPRCALHCYLPGTKVSGRFVSGSKSFYSGPAREIVTRGGRRLRLTTNHPVLTGDGWTRAGDIREGSKLVGYEGQVGCHSLGEPNNDKGEVPIEDVFASLASCGASTGTTVADDFHGDAFWMDEHVEIVGAAAGLGSDAKTTIPQEEHEIGLVATPAGVPSATSSNGAFVLNRKWHPSPYRMGTAKSVKHSLGGVLPLRELGFATTTDMDAVLDEAGAKRVVVDSSVTSELVEGFPGVVSLDEVVEIHDFFFRGHVFDLQEQSGAMIANRIVCGNCRYEAASGALIDLSTHGNDSSVNTGVTYQQTTNAFVEESAVVQSIDEFTNSNDQERIVTVIDGTIVVGNINV